MSVLLSGTVFIVGALPVPRVAFLAFAATREKWAALNVDEFFPRRKLRRKGGWHPLAREVDGPVLPEKWMAPSCPMSVCRTETIARKEARDPERPRGFVFSVLYNDGCVGP